MVCINWEIPKCLRSVVFADQFRLGTMKVRCLRDLMFKHLKEDYLQHCIVPLQIFGQKCQALLTGLEPGFGLVTLRPYVHPPMYANVTSITRPYRGLKFRVHQCQVLGFEWIAG